MKFYFLISACVIGPMLLSPQKSFAQTRFDSTYLTIETMAKNLEVPRKILRGPDDHIWSTELLRNVKRINPEDCAINNPPTIKEVESVSESGLFGMEPQPRFLPIVSPMIISDGDKKISYTFTAMTYNIRYATVTDGENQWENRKERVAGLIRFHEPDVVGIQEGLQGQVEFLDSALAAYSFVGTGRDDGKTGGEYSALFYNTHTFELVKDGQFWLSETPDVPSKGWDAALNRVCTYAFLKSKHSGQMLLAMNTHFDHMGNLARLNSAKLILEKIKELNTEDLPLILTGDFNLTPESDGIQLLSKNLKDAFEHSDLSPFGPVGTFNSFLFCEPVDDRRIDYIFVSKGIAVNKYAVLTDSYEQKYLSDHFPIIVRLKIKNARKE